MRIIDIGSLSGSDVEAILAAVPLAFAPEFETDTTQTEINMIYAESLGRKLISRDTSLTPNESRIMCVAVMAAQQYLSGKVQLSLEPETQSAISKHFFSYNRLAPSCEKAIEILDQHNGSSQDLNN